jgi:hypothetical protein
MGFQINEVVRVCRKVITDKKKWDLTGEIGIIISPGNENEDGSIDRLVGFNTYGEAIVVPEKSLESLGRIADPSEFVPRTKWRGRVDSGK